MTISYLSFGHDVRKKGMRVRGKREGIKITNGRKVGEREGEK
jgi:hypothetical protein